MISSSCRRSDSGIVRPNAFAVLRRLGGGPIRSPAGADGRGTVAQGGYPGYVLHSSWPRREEGHKESLAPPRQKNVQAVDSSFRLLITFAYLFYNAEYMSGWATSALQRDVFHIACAYHASW